LGNDYLKALKDKDKQMLGKSVSLPRISLPGETSLKPNYKNYLTEVRMKVKRKEANDEIQ